MKLSIGAQIRLLVTVVALGLGLCVLATFRILAARQAERTIRADGEAVQSALRMVVRGRGGLQVKLTHFLATTPRVTNLAVADDATVADVIENLRQDAAVDGVFLFGQTGRLLAASGVGGVAKTRKAAKGPIVDALAGRSRHAIVEADGDPLLVASEPLRIGGYVKGAIVTFLRMDRKMATDIGNSVRGNVAFSHDGLVLDSPLPIKGLAVRERAAPQTILVDGEPYIGQWGLLPNTEKGERLGVVTLRSVDDATAVYRQLTSAFVAVLGLVTLAALLGGAALTQTLTRPLGAVVAAAKVLQRGEWPARFDSARKDEVGLLQRVFDDMTTSMQASQAKLLAMIDKDPLTELDNHRSFRQRLDQESLRAAASGDGLALVLIDLDGFGEFNDDRGHEAGDRLLRGVALAVRAASPEVSVVSRYGADTFAVLVPALDSTAGLMGRLQAAVRACGARASMGAAQFHLHSKEGAGLTLAAELALGRAQQLGGDQAATFDAVRGSDDGADPYQVSRFMQDASFATIQALAAAVDAKDPYTKGHSLRVAEMARDLCAHLGGTPEETDRIYRAGTLHDVGKIGVPDAILKKPARLDDEERRVMETHPALGEIIVRKVPQLEDLLPGVRHHHEAFDGRGYPDGLAGSDIPRMARILAVADTYDAMTSDRPYRKGLPMEVALGEITKGMGTQFDPEMAAAFCEMVRSRSLVAV